MSDYRSGNFDDSWRLCRGPANWFTFRCPDEIDVRQNQTLIELRWRSEDSASPRNADGASESVATDSPSRVVLSMVTWWDDAETDANRRPSPDLGLLFPQVSALHPEPSLKIKSTNEVWSGVSRRPRTGCWLSRVFGRRSQYQWRLWTIRSGRLTIVATVQSPDRELLDPGFILICERVLATLEIAEQPAWPPECSFRLEACGAESVPRKKRSLPDVTARTSASR